jgi:hypothetical protein
MKGQGILALVSAAFVLGGAGASQAQGLPPQGLSPVYGAPVYQAQAATPGAPAVIAPPREVRSEPLPDDNVLLPQEIIGILRSTGFSPLSAPVRRGRFYVVAALHPDGEDGRVTMDAISGRFIRFVPADMIGGSMAAYPPPPFARPPRGLRPPLPLPNVVSRTPPIPATRPSAAPTTRPDSGGSAAAPADPPAQADANKTTETRTADVKTVDTKPAEPVETRQRFGKPAGPQLLPTQAMPPAQGFE